MEAGAMKLSPQLCDLAEICRGLLLAMRGIVGDRRIVLDVEGAAPVTADADLVTRIIQNLLGNALKFSPREREIRIRVRADDDALRFSVADTGPGVPKEFQQKIFEKSARSRPTPAGSESRLGSG
jgi:signal transduction histidine kinase